MRVVRYLHKHFNGEDIEYVKSELFSIFHPHSHLGPNFAPFASAIFLLDRRLEAGGDLSANAECAGAAGALGSGVPLASWMLFKTLVSGDDMTPSASPDSVGLIFGNVKRNSGVDAR